MTTATGHGLKLDLHLSKTKPAHTYVQIILDTHMSTKQAAGTSQSCVSRTWSPNDSVWKDYRRNVNVSGLMNETWVRNLIAKVLKALLVSCENSKVLDIT